MNCRSEDARSSRRGRGIRILYVAVGVVVFGVCSGVATHLSSWAKTGTLDERFVAATDFPEAMLLSEEFQVSPNQIRIHPIALMTGSLWEWTDVSAEVHHVRCGHVQGSCSMTVGTSGGRMDHAFLSYSLAAKLVLCHVRVEQSDICCLAVQGAPSAASSGGIVMTSKWQPSVHRAFSRYLSWSTKEIVYVEGTGDPVVSSGMSIEQFSQKNNGDYLVAILSLRARKR